MSSANYFDLICRLCTNQSNNLQPIFDIVSTKQFLQCTSLQIEEGDGMPGNMCEVCSKKLSDSYEFRLQCLQSDLKLREQLNYETLSKSKLKNENQVFQCQKLESYTNATQQLNNKLLNQSYVNVKDESEVFDTYAYSDYSVTDRDHDSEFVQTLKAEVSVVTRQVAKRAPRRKKKSDCNKNSDDVVLGVSDGNVKLENVVLRSPKLSAKRKVRRVNIKKVIKRSLSTDSEVEEKEPKIKDELDFKKKRIRKPKQCQICGKLCVWLRTHMLTHTGVRGFKCEYCAKSFIQLSHYKCHINIHTGNKPYSCTMCNKSFADPGSKRSHMVTHTKERKYKCDVCEKAFGYSHTLSAHKKTHTQDRKYVCSICNKAFLNKYGLTKHFRIHTGEKPYKCDFCDKTFTSSGNIQTHRRTHTRERPYTCDICQMNFSYRSVLNSHLKTHPKLC